MEPLREQPTEGNRCRAAGCQLPRTLDHAERPSRRVQIAHTHAATQEGVERPRVRPDGRRCTSHALEQLARRREIADCTVALQQRRKDYQVGMKAGGFHGLQRLLRALEVT